MGKNLKNEVEYYYDSHPTMEDLMGETSIHAELVRYLMLVLTWVFREQQCALYENLNFYQTSNPREYPLAPDIAVIKGVDYRHLRSWKVEKTGPAPHVVFEIASEETWKKDVEEKPLKYALMGVEEYFFYDPNPTPYWRRSRRRLLGWQINKANGAISEMTPDQEGRLWSEHLDSLLVPDGFSLRLYDSNYQLRLTGEEERTQEAGILAQERDTLLRERETLTRQTEALLQKLRLLGLDPDEI